MPKKPKVSVVMGSKSDLPVMKETLKVLKSFGIAHEVKVLSAHRTPRQVHKFASGAEERGIGVIIAGAGGAAHLAGVIAALTPLPVIGVPMETRSLKGVDSLFSTVQMPSGVPVATMSIGKSGAKNAAIFAAQVLGLGDEAIRKKIKSHKKKLAGAVKRI